MYGAGGAGTGQGEPLAGGTAGGPPAGGSGGAGSGGGPPEAEDKDFVNVGPDGRSLRFRDYTCPQEGSTPMNTDWMAEGKCREVAPAVFFPSDGLGVQSAQRICADCPVAEACLEYALVNRIDHGVWGGRSERERRRILRRRRVAAPAISA